MRSIVSFGLGVAWVHVMVYSRADDVTKVLLCLAGMLVIAILCGICSEETHR